MRRREFVVTGLTGLVASPAFGAIAPGTTVEIELEGQTYRYDSTTGVDLGPYTDPQGQFVQDCVRVDHPQLPLSIFIRPDRGSDRGWKWYSSWGGFGLPKSQKIFPSIRPGS